MKYVVAVDYFPNCRSCDHGYYSGLLFFNSIKDILSYAVKEKDDYQLNMVYSCKNGEPLFEIGYETARHSCIGVFFEHRGLHIRTQDNGKGELVWARQ